MESARKGFFNGPTLHFLRPGPAAAWPGQDLHPANGLQMLLRMVSHLRLHFRHGGVISDQQHGK